MTCVSLPNIFYITTCFDLKYLHFVPNYTMIIVVGMLS